MTQYYSKMYNKQFYKTNTVDDKQRAITFKNPTLPEIQKGLQAEYSDTSAIE